MKIINILILLIPLIISLSKDKKHRDGKFSKKKSDSRFKDEKELLKMNNSKGLKNSKKILSTIKNNVFEEFLDSLSTSDKGKLKNNSNDLYGYDKDGYPTMKAQELKTNNYEDRDSRLEKIKEERNRILNREDAFSVENSVDTETLEISEEDILNDFTDKELVKAVIMKEILDKPVSLR
ncbi:hypothetical protein [Peptoniphilus mikwangii]|uniref:hypothetical protein n=1 Tax=Peptoniphilus mikwangii TaxID=1354300 RepID=UPI0003FA4EA4|nr:hypothetical protein [Peptoniphilus mikwangii]